MGILVFSEHSLVALVALLVLVIDLVIDLVKMVVLLVAISTKEVLPLLLVSNYH